MRREPGDGPPAFSLNNELDQVFTFFLQMKSTAREYISAFLRFPFEAVRAFTLYGLKGKYLAAVICVFKSVPFSITLPPFGRLSLYNEFLSIYDNIIEKELRCEEIEASLKTSSRPVIVDLGINLGMTVRWWFSLNNNAAVYGIDMIPESLDFTAERLKTIPGSFNWTGIPSAISDHKQKFDIQYDDPLEGSNSVFLHEGKIKRTVEADTLDNLIAPFALTEVHLLKIDIEGYGAIALRGAGALLAACRYIILETHTPEETSEANRILTGTGWELFLVKGRSAFYRNPALLSK